jgi:hypothetical protein
MQSVHPQFHYAQDAMWSASIHTVSNPPRRYNTFLVRERFRDTRPAKGDMNDQILIELSRELRDLAKLAQGLPPTAYIPAKKLLEYAEAIESNVKSRTRQSD